MLFWETLAMPLGIGYLELAAILVCAVVASVMYIARMSQGSWYLVVLGCVMLASVVTPGDFFSMLIMAVAFLAVYFVGTRHPFKPSPTAG